VARRFHAGSDKRGGLDTFVIVAEYDPLRDEGVTYAERLRTAGVPVESREFEGAVHGLLGMLGTADIADEGIAAVSNAIRAAIAAGGRPSVVALG
jgi:acetyl esterase